MSDKYESCIKGEQMKITVEVEDISDKLFMTMAVGDGEYQGEKR